MSDSNCDGGNDLPSTTVASVEEIIEPFLEDELIESGMVAVVAMANVPLSLRLPYRPR